MANPEDFDKYLIAMAMLMIIALLLVVAYMFIH